MEVKDVHGKYGENGSRELLRVSKLIDPLPEAAGKVDRETANHSSAPLLANLDRGTRHRGVEARRGVLPAITEGSMASDGRFRFLDQLFPRSEPSLPGARTGGADRAPHSAPPGAQRHGAGSTRPRVSHTAQRLGRNNDRDLAVPSAPRSSAGALACALVGAFLLAALPASGTQASAAPAPLATLAPDAALALVVRTPWARTPLPGKEEVSAARRVLEGAAAREPASSRWPYGLGHAARIESMQAAGDAAAAKRKETKEWFAKAAERDPAKADLHYWHGTACFEMVDDVGKLSQASLARAGRKAYEKAIELDPAHVAAHYALGVFFAQAPGIVGGSTSKAKAQGEALLKIPDGKGAFWGRMLLARLAAEEKSWSEMSRQYTAAETAGGEGAEPALALQTHGGTLLSVKKDPAAVLALIPRYRAAAKPDDTAIDFFEADSYRQLGKCAEAVKGYEKVLARNPEARNTRMGIAECHEKLGNREQARKHYEEFARRFPKDERAAKAAEAAKRLR